jgi:hypothetical protein
MEKPHFFGNNHPSKMPFLEGISSKISGITEIDKKHSALLQQI